MIAVRFRSSKAMLVSLALVIAACPHVDPGDDADDAFGGDNDADKDTDADGETDVDGDTDVDRDSDSDGTPDCSIGCAGGTFDVDANPLTGICGCEYVCTFLSEMDAYDPAFTDSNCDGGDGVVDACVYVSAGLGSDTGGGTRADPRRTLAGAIEQAVLNAVPFVCVSAESYTETFTVPENVTLFGSFDHLDSDFPFRRKDGVATTVNGATLP